MLSVILLPGKQSPAPTPPESVVLSVHMMPRGTRCDACGGSAILHPAAFLRIPDNLPRGWEVSPNLCKADWASHLLCAS